LPNLMMKGSLFILLLAGCCSALRLPARPAAVSAAQQSRRGALSTFAAIATTAAASPVFARPMPDEKVETKPALPGTKAAKEAKAAAKVAPKAPEKPKPKAVEKPKAKAVEKPKAKAVEKPKAKPAAKKVERKKEEKKVVKKKAEKPKAKSKAKKSKPPPPPPRPRKKQSGGGPIGFLFGNLPLLALGGISYLALADDEAGEA